MHQHLKRATYLLLAGLLVVGCSKQPDKQADTSAPKTTQATSLPADQSSTKRYKIDISLPQLPSDAAPLATTLRQVANTAKREFLKMLPDPQQFPEFADRQMSLTLDFKQVADTARFISVRETGGEFTGGAHPIPIDASFVYDRKLQQVIPLTALFKAPDDARQQLADFSRKALMQQLDKRADKLSGEDAANWRKSSIEMISEGTKATAVNFSYFVVRAGANKSAPSPGISLIFPPYQVAAYVAGTQIVEVPAAQLSGLLKPAYQEAFARGS